MRFGRVYSQVTLSTQLSLDAVGLYAILCSLCGRKNYCYPTTEHLLSLTNCSRAKLYRLLKELTDQGVLRRELDPLQNLTRFTLLVHGTESHQ